MDAESKIAKYLYASSSHAATDTNIGTKETVGTDAVATKGDIAALLNEIKTMGANIGGKIDKITQRMNKIEERLDGFGNNQASIDTIETQMDLRIREIEQREEEEF